MHYAIGDIVGYPFLEKLHNINMKGINHEI